MNTKSLDLEASSSQYAYITDASQTGLDITGDMTIEAWINLESLPSSGAASTIAGKYKTTDNNRSYLVSITNNTGTIGLRFYNSDDGTNYQSATVSYAFSVSTWYHVAITYDASAGSADYYINGTKEGTTQTGFDTSIYNSSADFEIGSINSGGALLFDGLIDEVRIWNDIRTGTEISDNYQKELTGSETGLVGYWKFNDSALDETSNNNDLTLSGSPTYSTDVPNWTTIQTVSLTSKAAIKQSDVSQGLTSKAKIYYIQSQGLTSKAYIMNAGMESIQLKAAIKQSDVSRGFTSKGRIVHVRDYGFTSKAYIYYPDQVSTLQSRARIKGVRSGFVHIKSDNDYPKSVESEEYTIKSDNNYPKIVEDNRIL